MTELNALFGTDADTITWWQMSLRAVLIFFYLLILIRLAGKRAFGKITSFDIVLGMLLGSALGRTLTGNAKLIPTMAAGVVLVGLHSFLTGLAFRFPIVGYLIKGRGTTLVRDGEHLHQAMRKSGVTENDLAEAARTEGIRDPADIEYACLERNGDISVMGRQG